MYQIKITYQTGNSYNTYTDEDYIDISFKDIEVAKANLQRIKAHQDMYLKLNDWKSRKNQQTILNDHSENDWFVKETRFAIVKDLANNDYYCVDKKSDKTQDIIDSYYAENCINLYTDDNKKFKMNCFWIGHFESLISAKIIASGDDLEINF